MYKSERKAEPVPCSIVPMYPSRRMVIRMFRPLSSVPVEMNPADTGLYGRDFMTRLPGQNIIIVKPSDSATPIYPNNQNILDLTSKNEEEILVEKAVCIFCSKTFETRNMFKAKCMCSNALTHEECILNWSGAKGNNECDNCEQEVQSFSVDWHPVVSNQLQKSSKRGWISRLKRVWKKEVKRIKNKEQRKEKKKSHSSSC